MPALEIWKRGGVAQRRDSPKLASFQVSVRQTFLQATFRT